MRCSTDCNTHYNTHCSTHTLQHTAVHTFTHTETHLIQRNSHETLAILYRGSCLILLVCVVVCVAVCVFALALSHFCSWFLFFAHMYCHAPPYPPSSLSVTKTLPNARTHTIHLEESYCTPPLLDRAHWYVYSFVWHGCAFVCAPWRTSVWHDLHISDMTYCYVWHDSIICGT